MLALSGKSFLHSFLCQQVVQMDFKIFFLTNIICCCFCCFVVVTHVSGYCVHTFSADWSKRPKLYKDIDGHKTLIHIQGFSYRINETEVITAECETRILR